MKILTCLFCYIQLFLLSNNHHVLRNVLRLIVPTSFIQWWSLFWQQVQFFCDTKKHSGSRSCFRSRDPKHWSRFEFTQSYQAAPSFLPATIWEKAPWWRCSSTFVGDDFHVSQRHRWCFRNMVTFVFSSLVEKQSCSQPTSSFDLETFAFATSHLLLVISLGDLVCFQAVVELQGPQAHLLLGVSLIWDCYTAWVLSGFMRDHCVCEIHENCAGMSCLNTAQRLGTALMTSHTMEGHCEFHRFGFETKFTGEPLPWSMFVSSLLTTLYLL